jgi:ribosomal subunit interface protein
VSEEDTQPENGEWAMSLRVSGKNLDIGATFRTYIESRIRALFGKYRAGRPLGHVTVEREGSGFRADCTLHLNSGMTIQADAEAQDPYASFNVAAERLERRVHRFRKRLIGQRSVGLHESGDAQARPDTHGSRSESLVEPSLATSIPQPEPVAKSAAVIAEPSSQFKEMSVSSAVSELDLTNAPVVVFRHASDGRTNVVYRRPDGNIGWIDPSRP